MIPNKQVLWSSLKWQTYWWIDFSPTRYCCIEFSTLFLINRECPELLTMTVLKVGHKQTWQRAEFIKGSFCWSSNPLSLHCWHSFAMRTLGQSAQYFQMTFWLTEERWWEPQGWANIGTLKKLPLITEIFFITVGIYFSLSIWNSCTYSGVSGCLQSVCLTWLNGCGFLWAKGSCDGGTAVKNQPNKMQTTENPCTPRTITKLMWGKHPKMCQ